MKTKYFILSFFLSLLSPVVRGGNFSEEYDIRNYGAKGDGTTVNTKVIQAAIDSCSSNGGGIVYFAPNNIFLTGTVEIKSNVTLHLERNARRKTSLNGKNTRHLLTILL